MHKYVTLTEAAKMVPGRKPGRGVAVETIWRWCLRGIRNGIRLRSEMVGGHRCTTQPWLEEFISALNDGQGESTAPAPRTPNQRRQASERAAEELRRRWKRASKKKAGASGA